ncbi:hypothetical protein [Paraburkholderia caballeronis]|uniref:hypothetical protein n=1 Tax=Paraburkholderia caballeronis TaxID=416943 RepID=UPI003139EF5E
MPHFGRRRAVNGHHAPDLADCIDDGRAGRIGLGRRKRFHPAAAVRALREVQDVGLSRLQSGDGGLQYLQQSLIEQRHARRRRAKRIPNCAGWTQCHLCRVSGNTGRLEVSQSIAFVYRIRHISNGLRRLPYWRMRDHAISRSIDRRQPVRVFQTDIYAATLAGQPDTVK